MIDAESITHNTAMDVFCAAYIRRVGVGANRMSYGDLSDQTGIKVRTLKSWRDGQSMPHIDSLLKLCAVFGPSFTSEILAVAGQGGVENVESASEVDAICTVADLANVTNQITERLRDGVFCHQDKAAIAPLLLRLASKMEEQGKAMLAEIPR